MTTKSYAERLANFDLRRIIESPQDSDEEAYSVSEANAEAQRIWDRFGKSPNHRQRVVKLLAREVLDTMQPQASYPEAAEITSRRPSVLDE